MVLSIATKHVFKYEGSLC